MRVLAKNITATFGSFTDHGDLLLDENAVPAVGPDGGAVLLFDSHDPDPDFIGPPEVITTVLTMYGLTAGPGQCWIKDWSEHEGLAQSLADSGAVRIIQTSTDVGPRALRAHLIEVL